MSEKKSKKPLYIAIGAIIVVLIVVAAVFMGKSSKNKAADDKKKEKYENAMELLNEHRYEEAAEAFKELGDYKDSKERVDLCIEYRLGDIYDTALELLLEKRVSGQEAIETYGRAVEYFGHMKKEGFRDSAERYNQALDKLNEAYYEQAKTLIDVGDYELAVMYLNILGDYKDSKDLLKIAESGIDALGTVDTDALKNCQPGDEVRFGNYDNPIKWQVLDRQDDKVLLLSKYILAESVFCEGEAEQRWGQGTLFEWLNVNFYDIAFAEEEKAWIVESEISDSADTNLHILEADPVKCKVFLLSCDEVFEYIKSTKNRITTTALGEKKGWWLRSSLRDNRERRIFASFIDENGTMLLPDTAGHVWNTSSAYGVRPAIWIDASSIN